jgi:alpha-beta hydrolase superfamily lysophospholipase
MNSTLVAADGLALHLREWSVNPQRGTILIVHGLGEHIGRYAHVAACLNEIGWNVKGHDQRGHGRSAGERGVLNRPDDLLADLAAVIDAIRADARGPLVLLGHSLGGLLAARFVAEGLAPGRPAAWHRPVDALVLSSPALETSLTGTQSLLLQVLSRLAPNLTVANGLKPEWISRDASVVKAYEADPLVHDRVSPKLARFMIDSGAHVRALAGRWKMPTLLMWAGSDRCVLPAASAAFADAAPAGVVAAYEFKALSHEIFNEPECGEVLDELLSWLATWASGAVTVAQVHRPTLSAVPRTRPPS